MKVSSQTKLTRLVRIQCEVTRADIEAMLDDYESGMADATKSNAVSRSIRRTCELDDPVILVRSHGECPEIKIGGYRVAIETAITDWLRQVESGFMPKPFSFDLVIPEALAPGENVAVETIGAQPKPTAA